MAWTAEKINRIGLLARKEKMRTPIYKIDVPMQGSLAVMPRPRGDDWLIDEITAWGIEGIHIIVSLLEDCEISDLGLHREREFCLHCGIEFISFPVVDRGVPESTTRTFELARYLGAAVISREKVAIHCRAGIGRSALLAACVLAVAGYDPDSAFRLIAEARGLAVPDTDAQRAWVTAFKLAIPVV